MDAVAQLNAALAGRYDIEREIGAGGMATVYLARDVRHDRRVAVKLLNPELGAVLGVERFLSEIRVTANLQHPNLLPLFDSGEAQGLLFYVMPFVEGETLRHRLDREKQLPVDEAVRIAVAVGGALDYAHGHGVIHRDLKPENILLQHGQPVVADFGIALAVSKAGGQRVTQIGLSLGTPQYMSPEQATGDRGVDGRTDVYSLGAVTYEMLAGEPPHTGTNAQAIIAKLMTEEPRPITVLRRAVPPYVDAAVRCALEKLPADRFATAKEFADAIQGKGALPSGAVTALSAARGRPSAVARYAPWLVAALGLAAAGAAMLTRARPRPARAARFSITLPAGVTFDPTRGTIAVSPDGSRVVYLGVSDQSRLYVRALDEEESRVIAGTEGANFPFWSPDGAWIGFMAVDGKIKKVPAAGGTPTVIATIGRMVGPTWGPDGTIVFGGATGSGLLQVPATGGTPQPFTAIDSAHGEVWQALPMWSPDGTALFYTSYPNRLGAPRLAVATPAGAGALARTVILEQTGSSPRFAQPSSLLFANADGVVFRAPYDARRRALTGPPEMVVQDIFVRPPDHAMLGEAAGTLAYASGQPQSRLALAGARGALQLLPGEARQFRHPRVSPDGARVVVEAMAAGGKRDVWIYEMRTGALTRLTFDGQSADPVWSPDGARVAFSRPGDGGTGTDVYVAPADGSGTAELLVGGPGGQFPGAWSPDGRTFLFDEVPPGGGPMRIAAVTLGSACAGRAPCERRTLAGSPDAASRLIALSPDGRWLAYTSAETGRTEVYVRPMAGSGKWQVSAEGGTEPVWSRDGTRLYYREFRRIMAATVRTAPTFAVTARAPWVDDRAAREATINYDAHPDGRLLVLAPTEQGTRITVVLNWPEALRRRAAAGAR